MRAHFADVGPTLAAEALAERHWPNVSRETLRGRMLEDRIRLSRRRRKTVRRSRLRRGELIQIDGSEHLWFEDRASSCSRLVFIDEATGELTQLRFVPAQSAFAYFGALELYLQAHGRPVAFYSDKRSVFRVAKQSAQSGHGMTRFGRALNIEILCAIVSR